jgi:hypothetical protein
LIKSQPEAQIREILRSYIPGIWKSGELPPRLNSYPKPPLTFKALKVISTKSLLLYLLKKALL